AQRVVAVMQEQRLQDWLKGLLRLETGMKAYWLDEQGLPLRLFDLIDYQDKNPDFLKELWLKANAEIFKTLEGEFMNVTNDEDVFNLLANTYQTYTKSGKLSLTRPRNLKRFYDDIRQYGCESVKTRYSESQYCKLMSDLVNAGIPKAVLQNLHEQKDNNVIRFVELLKIDFGKQVPDWYEEPVSSFDFRPQPKLRLVS
uniref:phage/plasmid replication protein, II/X family n=1 Tax=Acinetobacter haemolyticus TaxID=29430 RepID=UPI001D18AF86